MNSNLNPYEILGVKESDTLEHIEDIYIKFLNILHPDKAHTKEAKNLNMRKEEKLEYLQLIRDAYASISSARRETKYPDYKMEYSVDKDLKINRYNGITEEETNKFADETISKKFNREFNNGIIRDKKAGMADAFDRGYGEFDMGKNFANEGPLTMPSYSADINVEPSKIFHRPDMKDNRLIEYIPESSEFIGAGVSYQELGLSNVSDFSMITYGKGSLGGTDLMSVYGQNYEPWEKTIMRDTKLSAKFTDNENVSQKMTQMESSRGSIYDLPIDTNMMKAEKARNFAREQKEKIKMANEQHRAEYYNSLNTGRLNDLLKTNRK